MNFLSLVFRKACKYLIQLWERFNFPFGVWHSTTMICGGLKKIHEVELCRFTPDKVPLKWCLGWHHLLTFMHDSAPLDNNLRESVFPLQARLCLFARNGKDHKSQLLRLAASCDTQHPEAIRRLFWVFLCVLPVASPRWGIQVIDGFLTCPLAAFASAETASVFIGMIRLRILGSTTHR